MMMMTTYLLTQSERAKRASKN